MRDNLLLLFLYAILTGLSIVTLVTQEYNNNLYYLAIYQSFIISLSFVIILSFIRESCLFFIIQKYDKIVSVLLLSLYVISFSCYVIINLYEDILNNNIMLTQYPLLLIYSYVSLIVNGLVIISVAILYLRFKI
jgi:hypothetical protein